MTSRERLAKTLKFEDPGKVVFDFGSGCSTGIHVSTLIKLRKALGLEDRKVKIWDPYGMLGYVDEDVMEAAGGDVLTVGPLGTMFGYRNTDWKPWRLDDGTEVLIGKGFGYTVGQDGTTYTYPCGDTSLSPCARLPKGGYYFDNIVRQGPVDEDHLDARADYAEDFTLLPDEELEQIEKNARYLYDHTGFAIVGGHFLGRIGDMATLTGDWINEPKGVRNIEDWLAYHYLHPEYIKDTYELATEVVIKNLEMYHQAVGERIQAIQISGTDFGTQRGEFISPDMYREFYKPYHKAINDWIHKNTTWKVYYHTCGSVVNLLDDFIEAGWDIFNTVQCSAANMDPKFLKEKCKGRLVLWGGLVDTQKTLPFGTPEEVREQVLQRLAIFAPGGGYVANPIHCVQSKTPTENLIAMFEAIREYNSSIKREV